MLNTSLWIAQVFVAAVMVLAGLLKLTRSREQLAKRFHWASSWEPWQIKMLGLAELTGAVGLVAPVATGIAPFLTPLAAANLFVLMAGAARTHQKLREGFVFPALLAALCVFVTVGRIAEHEDVRRASAAIPAKALVANLCHQADDGPGPGPIRPDERDAEPYGVSARLRGHW